MSLNAYKFETETGPAGKIELMVPVPEGTRVEVIVVVPGNEDFTDLLDAASSSMEFWDNSLDDADWNHA